jgi:hypothetical protein
MDEVYFTLALLAKARARQDQPFGLRLSADSRLR